ncbi:MAG: glycosyltransferase family 2 protein [Dehalococcoidia bacterium]|nr:glycosyltransferase family 2 protein [Dehalococcoidia bacterium]
MTLAASYILPVRRQVTTDIAELTGYLLWLNRHVSELIVVDGSPPDVFAHHARAWPGLRHVAPSPEIQASNGKVAGVLTGVALAGHESLVIADDDVRYDLRSLERVVALLGEASVVRPQNYFQPLPWHARWDSARSLINRVSGGDWPGTLAVRRSVLLSTRGYSGDSLFENLELVRTVRAAGGREAVARDLYVRRLPPSTAHFLSQRVRQAYDEFARPARLLWQLAILPLALTLAWRQPRALLGLGALSVAIAEAGRRRDGGARVFPASTSLFAPLWLTERAICSWLAVASRLRFGGVRYGNGVISHAATSLPQLKRQIEAQAEPARW